MRSLFAAIDVKASWFTPDEATDNYIKKILK